MTSWTAFVGQVARLRRLISRVLARARVRSRHVEPLPARAGAPAGGPPAHWVERVRQGAPGLLEPSLRSRDEATPSVDEDIAPPQPDAVAEPEAEAGGDIEAKPESDVERQPVPRAESEGGHLPTSDHFAAERQTAPRRAGARERAQSPRKPRLLRQKTRRSTARVLRTAPVLRTVLRRKQVSAEVPPASVDPSPAPAANDMPRELVTRASPQPAQQPLAPPATAFRFGRGPVDETEPRHVTAERTVHDEPRHRLHRSTVAEPRRARVGRTASSARRPVGLDAARPAAPEPARADRPVDGVRSERALRRVAGPPPPRSSPNVQRVPDETPKRPRAWAESSVRASQAPAFRDRDDPLSAVGGDPWPELPAPLDQADDEVETALRAWDRQRRLDREQTRL